MSCMRPGALVLVGLATLLCVETLWAQPTVRRETARPVASTDGKVLYTEYCAVCHGVGGKGDGPAAPALKVPPTDLTTYAKRHGGRFSEIALREIIEGAQPTPAHGSREMPIWGDVFRALESDLQIRQQRVHNLIGYLKSIQQK
jgi:mono/diheme cytochrome c family protein